MVAVAAAGFIAVSTPSQASEFSLLGPTPGDQDFPALSLGPTGGFAVWEDNRIGDPKHGRGIAAVALDGNFGATGTPFKVNHYSIGQMEKPQVVFLGGGNTLFVWEVRNGSRPGVYGRVMDASGKFVTGELLINVPSSKATVKQAARWFGYSRNSGKLRTYKFKDFVRHVREQAGGVAVAALPDGGAVAAFHAVRRSETNTWQLVRDVKWTGKKFSTNDLLRPLRLAGDWMQDVILQRLDGNGAKVGGEIIVNQYLDYNQRSPSLAVLPNGNIVVVWVSESPVSLDWRANFAVDLRGRVFDSQGLPVTDEFPVVGEDALVQANPVVAALAGGGFSVFWSQQQGGGSGNWDVYGRSFAADFSATGPAFRVNDYTNSDQFAPRVASVGDAQLVVWTSVGQDGSREGVYGRELAAGAISGPEFRINTTTVSRQLHPAVATDASGRALVVWAGYAGETGFDLFAARHSIVVSQPEGATP